MYLASGAANFFRATAASCVVPRATISCRLVQRWISSGVGGGFVGLSDVAMFFHSMNGRPIRVESEVENRRAELRNGPKRVKKLIRSASLRLCGNASCRLEYWGSDQHDLTKYHARPLDRTLGDASNDLSAKWVSVPQPGLNPLQRRKDFPEVRGMTEEHGFHCVVICPPLGETSIRGNQLERAPA